MAMSYQKATRPSRQANGRECKSNDSLAHEDFGRMAAAAAALVLFMTLVLPRIMYAVIAPMKGWV